MKERESEAWGKQYIYFSKTSRAAGGMTGCESNCCEEQVKVCA